MLQENRQILWDFISSYQICSIGSRVELLAEILAQLVNLGNGIRESNIRIFGIIETNCSQALQLIFFTCLINVFFFFGKLNAFIGFKITDTVKSSNFSFESTKMV